MLRVFRVKKYTDRGIIIRNNPAADAILSVQKIPKFITKYSTDGNGYNYSTDQRLSIYHCPGSSFSQYDNYTYPWTVQHNTNHWYFGEICYCNDVNISHIHFNRNSDYSIMREDTDIIGLVL